VTSPHSAYSESVSLAELFNCRVVCHQYISTCEATVYSFRNSGKHNRLYHRRGPKGQLEDEVSVLERGWRQLTLIGLGGDHGRLIAHTTKVFCVTVFFITSVLCVHSTNGENFTMHFILP